MKKQRTGITVMALACASAMALAGCGSSGTSSSGAADTQAAAAQTAAAGESTAAAAEAAADSAAAESAGTDSQAAGEKKKMTLLLRGGTYSDVIKADLPTFEEENNVDIEVLDMSFDDLHTDIALDAPNATGTYDLIMVDGSWKAEFTQNGVLANLSELGYSFDDDIIPNTTTICMDGDDIYLAPYFGNVTVMLYNKKNLADIGVAPEDINNLDTLLSAAQAAQQNGVNGFAYRGDTGDNIVSDFLPILLAEGGWVVDENNQPTVDTDVYKKAMNYYLDLVATGSAMSKDDVTAAIDNGNATLAIGWPGWYVPTADSAADYEMSPVSEKEGGEAYSTSEYGTWTIGIPANAPDKELSLKLLEYIMDPDVQLGSVKNGGVPCRYSVLQNEDVLKDYPQFKTVCEALENGVYRPAITQWSEFTNILGTEMGNIIAGTKDMDTGLADAQKQLEDLMAE